jgi:hypothetical protein
VTLVHAWGTGTTYHNPGPNQLRKLADVVRPAHEEAAAWLEQSGAKLAPRSED